MAPIFFRHVVKFKISFIEDGVHGFGVRDDYDIGYLKCDIREQLLDVCHIGKLRVVGVL